MRASTSTTTSFATLAALLSTISALTITNPAAGTTIDPSIPLEITWTTSPSDPTTIDLKFNNVDTSNTLASDITLASSVSTSSGKYIVSANMIQNFGTGYQIQATTPGSQGGVVIAECLGLSLALGSGSVIPGGFGGLTFISKASTAQIPAAAAQTPATDSLTVYSFSATGVTIDTLGVASTAVSDSASASAAASATASSASGFITSSTSKSAAVTSAASVTESTTSESETSATSTSAAPASTTSSNENSASGLMRLGASEVVLSAAGVLAGLVALLA